MNKFKIGDIVKVYNSEYQNWHLNNKIGKIVDHHRIHSTHYLVEFFDYINSHDGKGWNKSGKRFKHGHCRYIWEDDLHIAFSPLDVYLYQKGKM